MIRRNPAEWRQLIEEHAHSKLNATEFCKIKGIDPKYFSLRKSQLKNNTASSAFIEVQAPITTVSELTLSWADTEIHFPADTSPIWLAQFMRELVK